MTRFALSHATALVLVCSALGALAPASAGAQATAAIMPAVGGHREIPEAARDEARRAALELLRSEDVIVLEATHVEAVLDEAQRACAPGAPCAAAVHAALGAELLVGLVIWGTPDAPATPGSVRVSILDGHGARYVGGANVEQGVATAVRDALRSALRDQRRGPGPFVEVRGTRGAVVELDGAVAGTIPVTLRTSAGEHRLRVSLDDHVPEARSVTIPDDPAHTTEITVELRRGGGGGSSGGGGETWPSWLLAGGLFAGSVALAVAPFWTLATEGECLDGGANGCRERVVFDAGMGVMLGLSGALLAGAVVVAIAQPIVLSASISTDGAQLRLGGSF